MWSGILQVDNIDLSLKSSNLVKPLPRNHLFVFMFGCFCWSRPSDTYLFGSRCFQPWESECPEGSAHSISISSFPVYISATVQWTQTDEKSLVSVQGSDRLLLFTVTAADLKAWRQQNATSMVDWKQDHVCERQYGNWSNEGGIKARHFRFQFYISITTSCSPLELQICFQEEE